MRFYDGTAKQALDGLTKALLGLALACVQRRCVGIEKVDREVFAMMCVSVW